MASVTYPSDAPTDSIKILVEVLTGRREKDIKEILLHGWWTQGYLQSLVLGAPQTAVLAYAEEPEVEEQQVILALETLAGGRNKRKEMSANGLIGDITGKALKETLARMILPVLARWLKEWLEEGGLERLLDRLKGSN